MPQCQHSNHAFPQPTCSAAHVVVSLLRGPACTLLSWSSVTGWGCCTWGGALGPCHCQVTRHAVVLGHTGLHDSCCGALVCQQGAGGGAAAHCSCCRGGCCCRQGHLSCSSRAWCSTRAAPRRACRLHTHGAPASKTQAGKQTCAGLLEDLAAVYALCRLVEQAGKHSRQQFGVCMLPLQAIGGRAGMLVCSHRGVVRQGSGSGLLCCLHPASWSSLRDVHAPCSWRAALVASRLGSTALIPCMQRICHASSSARCCCGWLCCVCCCCCCCCGLGCCRGLLLVQLQQGVAGLICQA
jgi:hypothetical protein